MEEKNAGSHEIVRTRLSWVYPKSPVYAEGRDQAGKLTHAPVLFPPHRASDRTARYASISPVGYAQTSSVIMQLQSLTLC